MDAQSITQLEPQIVWKYFSEITAIPRCSRHLDAICEYIRAFAKEHGYAYKEDASGNIVVYKPGTNKKIEPILLQAHLDMVCEAVPDSGKDMLCDPPIPVIDGDWVRARNSSLGGDDGVGVALILSVLASSSSHPPIEALFTVDEEIGLVGAREFDIRLISAKRMINIDSEDEGVFTISAAGGNETRGSLPISYEEAPRENKAYKIVISGLQGGHSGVKIHEGRANSVVLFARVFHHLSQHAELQLASLDCGGMRSNVIPSHASAVITSTVEIDVSLVDAFAGQLRDEYASLEPNLQISFQEVSTPEKALKPASTQRIIALLNILPCGVLAFSRHFSGVVESSANIACVRLTDAACEVLTSQRSLFEHALDYYTEKTETGFHIFGGTVETSARYASWPPQKKDDLVRHLVSTYEKLFDHRKPFTEVIHAGLECGEIIKKDPDVEVVSIGADMEDVHSVKERVSISSIARMWKFLQAALEQL